MAAGLTGSEILRIAGEIRAMMAEGAPVCNLTVGDFSPSEFGIPDLLRDAICEALAAGETNYPPSDGVPELRDAVVEFYREWLGLDYRRDEVLVTGGSRPGIYSTYRALVDPGDTVVYPTPSWNNNHYVHLVGARGVPVVCRSEDAFLPTRARLEPVIEGARLLALNSPLNPAGTAFSGDALGEICDLVLEENRRRSADERPLYLMYDQVYWMLTFGGLEHVTPVALRPEIAEYTVFIDGISKPFAATGVRVGWTVAPPDITQRMASILGHVGAWAPRAEQIATARLLHDTAAIRAYHEQMKAGLRIRLDALYTGLMRLQEEGLAVEAIAPMGAIYLSVRFALHGRRAPDGTVLRTNDDVRGYLLQHGLAMVPFQAFGMPDDSGWFRFSVGATSLAGIDDMLVRLRPALQALTE
jgi:aspartate aminotransferase